MSDGLGYSNDINENLTRLNLLNTVNRKSKPIPSIIDTSKPNSKNLKGGTNVNCNTNKVDTTLKRKSSISTEDLHSSNSSSSSINGTISCNSSSYELDTKYNTPINSLYLWSDERRPPRWPRGFKLSDKISQFLKFNIAEKSEFREIEPNTLTICSQYTLENHESMVSDSDRVHYYRMALFWTGHQEYFNEKTKYYATGKRVLEIGTGPMCILAMNAKNAGAKRVDALEVNLNAARLAHKLMSAYGVDDIIKVYNVHSKDYWPENPEDGYDMIVSEIIGDFASQEGLCDVYLDLQQRLFNGDIERIRNIHYIPMSASTWFVPCTFPDQENVLYKAQKYSELTIFSPSFKMFQSVDLRIDNLPLCSEWLPLEQIYLNEDLSVQQCQHKISVFKIDRNRGPMCGFLVGIDVEIRPGEHFGTRFGHCDSWYTNIVLLNLEYNLKEGDTVMVYSIANMKNYAKTCKGFMVTKPSYTFKAYHVRYMSDQLVTSVSIPCNCTETNVTGIDNNEDATASANRLDKTESDDEYDFMDYLNGVDIIKELGIIVIDYKEQASTIIQIETKKIKKTNIKPEKPKQYKANARLW
ncbi:hypothetical protein BmR1_04g08850 [Babesia microti strain RI]|uniref:Uncharacterized protein n=1 Tax=Babesia microti (strain RI) TaxID=1133968 RepID=I7IHK0_BABMR|nr:hypothetical protein BmR1_04g08850 [Babesia microti strain RI]CCF75947.1 hypothetical protein BmR1_04g08850 [Babesia microti strain RI]|eukprot:XP_012650355.1 hypothetical protein BmR1_04g08850 [Babesia microti strain RI]